MDLALPLNSSHSMLLPLITALLLLADVSLENELKIISSPDGISRPAPCALTCAGVTAGTDWSDSQLYFMRSFVVIDTQECGFMSKPVVTTMGEPADGREPTVNFFLSSVSGNLIYVYTQDIVSARHANTNGWRVHWSAFGYNCE